MITSLSNTKIKNLAKLHFKSSERKLKKAFVIEGRRELSIAQRSGVEILEIFICDDLYNENPVYPIDINNCEVTHVSSDVYKKIAYRKDTEGVIGIAKTSYIDLNKLYLPSNPLVLILESIEKPGNLGGILRTADATKIDAVIVCDPKIDLYNPNVIRSSLGCIFSNKVVLSNSDEVVKWLKEKRINIYATLPESSEDYYKMDFKKPSALVFGSESDGLSNIWKETSGYKIKIPMMGKIDSLNVSISTAVVIYEALRQRKMFCD